MASACLDDAIYLRNFGEALLLHSLGWRQKYKTARRDRRSLRQDEGTGCTITSVVMFRRRMIDFRALTDESKELLNQDWNVQKFHLSCIQHRL